MKIPLFLKAFNSPFKRPKLYWYFGKIALGVPVFFPRVWVKATPKKAIEAALEEIKRVKEWNEKEGSYKQTVKSFDVLYEQYLRYSFAQPRKIGFDFVGLRWKTKWSDIDFRHEYNPIWSFVCFGYQIAIRFIPKDDCHYWECFLFYSLATDRTKSKKERIEYCRKEFPCKWTTYKDGVKEKICYWDVILKEKYK